MAGALLLSVNDAVISFGGKKLFDGLSFNISEGEKICLVGKNGAGKTTLMNIITGAAALDDGVRWKMESAVVGYLQQEVVPKPGQSVFDFVFEEIKPEDGHSEEDMRVIKAYKVDMVIRPLDLDPDMSMDKLSGGQLRRAALARALVEEPDILLLDEPTNHLDLDVIEWLENFLRGWRGALVCISHDKAFLATISDKVFWLDRGRLRVCPRGFGQFEEWMIAQLEQEERELKNREKAMAIEVEWASRGVKARRKRNQRRLEMMKVERERLRGDRSVFNRMMARVELPPAEEAELSSRMMAEFKNVYKSFTDDAREAIILDKFNVRVMRKDRIGVLGRNGSGKTTFLRMLLGEIKPDQGTVKLAKDIEYSYFDQKRRDLDLTKTLWETMCPNGGEHVNVRGGQRHVVGYLKDFLFDPSIVHQKVSTLSGGQKNRLMLAKVLANPKSLLILDEPTNDLDMDTLDMLEEVLMDYEGTLFVVSHDRDFLDQTVSKILAFEGNGVVEGYIGGYTDYLEAKTAKSKPTKVVVEEAPRNNKKKSGKPALVGETDAASQSPQRKMSYKLEYELENLPKQMAKLEKEIGGLEDFLNDPEIYKSDPGGFQTNARRLAQAREELEALETRWLELEDMRNSAAS